MPIILIGEFAAAPGRFALAHAFRIGRRVPARIRGNLAAARTALKQNKRGGLFALGLFALSPLPSAQLFEAAGLARFRLAGFTAAFFTGRLISYSIYAVSAKGMQRTSMGEQFLKMFTSPASIIIQVFMTAALVVLTRVNWQKRLGGNRTEGREART